MPPHSRQHTRRAPLPTGARTTGVRDLKAHLSAYLRRVREGETVTITDRGEVIAQLTPSPLSPPEDALERTLALLERAGQIVRPALTMTQLRARMLATSKGRAAARPGATQRILDLDREERS